jgi:hypothetical protein
MSLIKSLMITEKVVSVEFPDVDGFFVDVCYLSKEKLLKLRNQSLKTSFNKRTRQREEEVDSDKFLELYSEAIIRGWKGLTIRILSELLPIETAGADPNEEIAYSKEEAFFLLKNSTIFDQFINDTINNFNVFETDKKDENIKN